MMASLADAFRSLKGSLDQHRAVALTYSTGKVTAASPLTVSDVDGASFKPVDMLAGLHTYTVDEAVGILRTPSSRPLAFPLT